MDNRNGRVSFEDSRLRFFFKFWPGTLLTAVPVNYVETDADFATV